MEVKKKTLAKKLLKIRHRNKEFFYKIETLTISQIFSHIVYVKCIHKSVTTLKGSC